MRKIVEAGIEWIQVGLDDLIRTDAVKRVAPIDIVDETTGEVIIECNEDLTQAHLDQLRDRGINEFPLLYLDPLITGTALRDTLLADKTLTQEEGIIEIYRRLRPGDPPTVDTATNLFRNLFFNPERYDLSRVGRLKVNHKLGFEPDERVEAQVGRRQRRKREIPLRELPTLRPRGHPGRLQVPGRPEERRRSRASASTTSTTWATGACAWWASCSRTSTASAWCAWSARSRSACRSRRSRR